MTGRLPADLAAACAARPELAARVFDYAEVVTSTNDRAVALAAAGAADGTTVLADRQTAGRGRRGRTWHSPPQAGLYLSVVLTPAPSSGLTLVAGIAVAESIRAAAGIAAELKWPNDVMVRSPPDADDRPRKVAGILAEGLSSRPGGGVVLGIGVNVRGGELPADLAGVATSLEEATGQPVARGPVCADILVRLDEWRARLARDGIAPVVDRWRALSPSGHGATVSWDAAGERHRGVTAGVDAAGALLVECDGVMRRVVGGALTWER